MKTKLLFFNFLFFFVFANAQTIPFDYSVQLHPVTVNNLPGLQSFAFAQAGGKWLIIGGRIDGLHARQPFNAFPESGSNAAIYVIDIAAQQFWTAPETSLSTGLQEQLQSTNMNFYQDADTLYLLGGYGYSNTAADHITYPNLTSVSVSGLINAVISNSPVSPYFKQITDQNFAVTGGHLGKIGNEFYLVGGHRFDGRYNPMGGPTYTQTYVDGIRKFTIDNSGSQLSYSNYSVITDQVHLHRRDYNLMPQIFPDGSEGYMISSGVFQVNIDLPFLYPVEIKASGYTPVTTFNQYLSNYHSANVALYDSVANSMHSLFFGGMSQYYYVNNVLTQDNNVPFVKTISRVSRDANGNLEEDAFANEMPSLIGASAEFIPNDSLSHYTSGVIRLSGLNGDSVLIGHICGGIFSTQLNPFASNNTGVTSASSGIYEVWLVRNVSTGQVPLNGSNPFSASVFPNPSGNAFRANVDLPYSGYLNLNVTDINGKIVRTIGFGALDAGKQTLDLGGKLKLPAGVYTFNFVFDGKFSAVEKVVVD